MRNVLFIWVLLNQPYGTEAPWREPFFTRGECQHIARLLQAEEFDAPKYKPKTKCIRQKMSEECMRLFEFRSKLVTSPRNWGAGPSAQLDYCIDTGKTRVEAGIVEEVEPDVTQYKTWTTTEPPPGTWDPKDWDEWYKREFGK